MIILSLSGEEMLQVSFFGVWGWNDNISTKKALCVMTPPVSSEERRNSWFVGILEQKIIDYVVI